MNNSNKKLTLFTSPPSKFAPEYLPKPDFQKLILTLFAMEHLQSTTLLIQSICFFQLVNKPSLQSNPMTQSARSHTTLAITWTLTPKPTFDSKNHSKQIWILSGRDTSSQAIHLQLCRFIGQDLADLEPCFDYQKDFNEIRAHKIRIFNFVRLLVKTWQLWILVLIIKRFQ